MRLPRRFAPRNDYLIKSFTIKLSPVRLTEFRDFTLQEYRFYNRPANGPIGDRALQFKNKGRAGSPNAPMNGTRMDAVQPGSRFMEEGEAKRKDGKSGSPVTPERL